MSAGATGSFDTIQYGSRQMYGVGAFVDAESTGHFGLEAEGRWIEFPKIRQALATETPIKEGQLDPLMSIFSPENAKFNDAKDIVGFVDGHVDYIGIYWSGSPPGSLAMFYDPPAGYGYQWSGD